MSNRTYRVTEVVGTSPEGVDDAIQQRRQPGVAGRCVTWTGSR